MSELTCHDCGAKEGEIHHLGCDMERCPFCGGQLIGCGCEYRLLGYDYQGWSGDHPTNGLPIDVYDNGLPEEEWETYVSLLEEKGRIPYILYPNLCARCGTLWPDMFMVPNEEWERYIEPDMRRSVLCRECYDYIKRVIDNGVAKAERGNNG